MRIDRREQLMVVNLYPSHPKHEISMLPYKMQQDIYTEDYTSRRPARIQDHSERKDPDSSSFDELARKVDWLYEEVRYIKQTLDTYRRSSDGNYEHSSPYRGYNHPRMHERSSRQEMLRSNTINVPTERIRYYEQQSRSNREPVPQGYLPSTTAPTSTVNTTSRPYTRSDSSYDECTPPQSVATRSFTPRELGPPRSDRDSVTYSTSSPPLSIAKSDTQGGDLLHNILEDITIAEVVILWERGMNDVPPIAEWDVQDKLKNRERLELFFKVYHIYRVVCNADLSLFASQYTDGLGRMKSPAYVASLCTDVSESFETFLQASKPQSSAHDDSSTDKLYTLPRKINGRKVSAKDVIQLWEYGMGDVPPIKTWTKAQKFKQQSKISRWKKIVDIFKYQCNSDMRKFEEIYTDSHGCLLPVAAITNKFETLYGDELNITSKLMTVTTSEQQKQSTDVNRKRRLTEGSLSDGESNNGYPSQYPLDEHETTNLSALLPPLLVPANAVVSPHKFLKRDDGDEKFMSHSSNNDIIKVNRSDSSPSNHSGDKKDSLTYEEQSSPSSISSTANDDNNDIFKRSASVIYILPDAFTLKDAITYWENGSQDFPPVKTWTHVQNSIQQDLIVKIEKLYEIYTEQFQQDLEKMLSSAIEEGGEELGVDQFLSKYVHQEARKLPNANSMTFDFSHHKTISQSTDALYLLPRKINGRKVSAKDVLQLWYHGLNKIPPVKQWSPQQKAVQQSKISRWKKIVELFEQDFGANWEKFKKHYSNSLGQLLPITAIISKHEEESRSMTEGAYHPNL